MAVATGATGGDSIDFAVASAGALLASVSTIWDGAGDWSASALLFELPPPPTAPMMIDPTTRSASRPPPAPISFHGVAGFGRRKVSSDRTVPSSWETQSQPSFSNLAIVLASKPRTVFTDLVSYFTPVAVVMLLLPLGPDIGHSTRA